MNTNAGRNIVIKDNEKWYLYSHPMKNVDIYTRDIYTAVKNLESYIHKLPIDFSNFEYLCDYDNYSSANVDRAITTNQDKDNVPEFGLIGLYHVATLEAK